ncbi:c-type cytochrome [Roseibium sp.]|uniref:c-type cytochrome n=1 Tax=Roseibium sp. TaxID=1936156 RepID=UPI003A96C05D
MSRHVCEGIALDAKARMSFPFGLFSAKTRSRILASFLSLAALHTTASASEPDIAAGEKAFKACKSCHQVGTNAANGIGPHLDGLFGRIAGSLPGFKYSSAMKAKGENGLLWNEETLNAYLEKPNVFVPGTRMSYRGMSEMTDRRNIIAYLKDVTGAAPADNAEAAAPARAEIGAAAMAMVGDVAYGEYLSTECVTCHQVSGRADGIPSIIGWPKNAFIRALFEYKSNVRSHQVMQNMTVNLGNEEIAALAAFFGSIEPK